MLSVRARRNFSRRPKVSFILLDWSCRESFHTLDYLSNQTVAREDYEIIWIEFYNRASEGLKQKRDAILQGGKADPLDTWMILGYADDVYYHKHLMYNCGIALAQGDVVIISDSDAIYPENFVETIIAEFEQPGKLVLHVDEVRNNNEKFHPFAYPSVEEILGDGVVNWRDGKTTGLWEKEDPVHALNYGACMCARRNDIIAIGGADEHLDYLGHICGPYDITFRLQNFGFRETWLDSLYIYHVWHPGSDGDMNYLGPTDGRHMSSTALEIRSNGRILPLLENPAITLLREAGPGATFSDEQLLALLPNNSMGLSWTKDEVKKNPRFTLWRRPVHVQQVEVYRNYNILKYGNEYCGVPHSLGPRDMRDEENRTLPGVVWGDSPYAVRRAILQSGFVEATDYSPLRNAMINFIMIPLKTRLRRLLSPRAYYSLATFWRSIRTASS